MNSKLSLLCRRARRPLGLVVLLMFSAAASAENLWRASYGQGWFYEVRSGGGQLMAGSWWESGLTPGKTYTISFNVKNLEGVVGLWLGGNSVIEVDKAGSHSYDFAISEGGKRRLVFTSLRNGAAGRVLASVNSISVSESGGGTSGGATSPPPSGGTVTGMPKGHYLAFNRERNLKKEMMDIIDNPSSAASSYHLQMAQDLHGALTTPGVKGFSVDFDWRVLETADGVFSWRMVDDNMKVARRYGLKFIVKVGDRSFNGQNIMPSYFPAKYVLQTSTGGKTGYVAKRWDPWVYNRTIRLYKAIINRYGSDAAFGGIATSETATNYSGGDYSIAKYKTALTQIATQTQAAMQRGKLFLYMNFLPQGVSRDMNKDGRVQVVKNIPHNAIAIGGPDITPDAVGMPGFMNGYRIHVRKTMPNVPQFCHAQHVDQGLGGINRKSNKHRQSYFDFVKTVRARESQSWFTGKPAVFEYEDLRSPSGQKVNLHPTSVVGDLWHPRELFNFATRNFDCDYFFWHYRENVHNLNTQFWWPDIQPIILNNQYFYN